MDNQNPFDLLDDDAQAANVGTPVPLEENEANKVRSGRGRPKAHTKVAHPHGVHGHGRRPPQREFDKHSAPGHGKVVKKSGGGKFNWGGDQEEIEQGLKEVSLEDAAVVSGDNVEANQDGSANNNNNNNNSSAVVADLNDGKKTLEQFLAEKARLSVDEDRKERSIVSEGKGFKNAEVLGERNDENPFADCVKPKTLKKKEKGQGKNTVHLDEFVQTLPAVSSTNNASVHDETRPDSGLRGQSRGGYRGRGGFRGGNRGGYRGENRGGFRGENRGGYRGGRGGFRNNNNNNNMDNNNSVDNNNNNNNIDESSGNNDNNNNGGGFRGGYRGRGGFRGGYRGNNRGGYRGNSRGGYRGGRGGYRGNSNSGANFNENDFPSLSSN